MDRLKRMQEILDRVHVEGTPPTPEELSEIILFMNDLKPMFSAIIDSYLSAVAPVLEVVTAWWFALDPGIKMALQDHMASANAVTMFPMPGGMMKDMHAYRPNRYRGEEITSYLRVPSE